jgi:hypothetical protein
MLAGIAKHRNLEILELPASFATWIEEEREAKADAGHQGLLNGRYLLLWLFEISLDARTCGQVRVSRFLDRFIPGLNSRKEAPRKSEPDNRNARLEILTMEEGKERCLH